MNQIEQLQSLLKLFKSSQRDLLLACAKVGTLPSNADLRRISDYEAAIAALEALIAEERRK